MVGGVDLGGVYRVTNAVVPLLTHPDDDATLRTVNAFAMQLRTEVLRMDGSNETRADLSMEGHRILNSGRPMVPADCSNKQYVDEVDQPVRPELQDGHF